jgi:DNA-binding NarL/FixJ family response regulator
VTSDSQARDNGEGIEVALAIDDSELGDRVLRALAERAGRFVVTTDVRAADVLIADSPAVERSPAQAAAVIVIGQRSALEDAVRRGYGTLSPSFSNEKLRTAIEAAAAGLICAEAHGERTFVFDDEAEAENAPELTLREVEVLRQLITGASNKEIARRLNISIHTAKFHVASVVTKLGATGRTDAVARAMRLARSMI